MLQVGVDWKRYSCPILWLRREAGECLAGLLPEGHELRVAFEKFISWEVRFLIAGNTRTGGAIELPIAHAARKVYAGEITTTRTLTAELVAQGAIPTDEEFRRQFEVATVAKASLAVVSKEVVH